MKKVFNKSALVSFIRALYNYEINFISLDDFVNKSFFKKIKDLKYIHNAKSLFNWMKENDVENILPMVRKFFPTKMEEIENSGMAFDIVDFYFDTIKVLDFSNNQVPIYGNYTKVTYVGTNFFGADGVYNIDLRVGNE